MKYPILFIIMSLIPGISVCGEKIEQLEVFGKTQLLPAYCEISDKDNDILSIQCVPPDHINIVSIHFMKSYNCKDEIMLNRNDGLNPHESELVNTTVNGIWYYEFVLTSDLNFAIHSRNIYDGNDCLFVSSSNKGTLIDVTRSLWF